MLVHRHLDHREKSMHGLYYSYTVSYRGLMDQQSLAEAFRRLRGQYAVLRARIDRDNGGLFLEVTDDNYSELTVIDGDEATLQREFSRSLDSSRALAYLILVRSESEGFVCLRVDHAVADGAVYFAMYAELWHLYTEITEGRSTSFRRGCPLPPSNTELFASRWAEIEPMVPTVECRPVHVCEVIARRIILGQEDTRRLIAAAGVNRTTIGALLGGAVAVTFQRHHIARKSESKFRALYSVDLRAHVDPPVSIMDATNLTGVAVAVVDIHANSNPVEIGRELGAQLREAISRREVHLYSDSTKHAVRADLLSVDNFDVWINNLGVVPAFALPRGMEIARFFSAPTTASTNGVKVPRHKGFPPGHGILTYDGEMTISFSYPSDDYTRDQMDCVVLETVEQLRDITKSALRPKILREADLIRLEA